MVDQTQRLSRYRELIQELNETKKMEIARRTVELFFSFDIHRCIKQSTTQDGIM